MPKNLYDLNEIGIALSSEHNIERLLEMILEQAKAISRADAGILFTRHELDDNALVQRVRHCDTLGIKVGGTTGEPTYGPPVELYLDGKAHTGSVTASSALTRQSINIKDIHNHPEYDFSSTREFDRRRNYQTRSVLAVPMITKRREVIGVIRLSNAQDKHGKIVPFSKEVQHLGRIAGLASSGSRWIMICSLPVWKICWNPFIQLVAKAIDNKSKHTGNHLQRIPVIVEMLAEAANASDSSIFKDFQLNEEGDVRAAHRRLAA